jgi:hypothetical protein
VKFGTRPYQAISLLVLAACASDGSGPGPTPDLDCDPVPAPTELTPGQATVIDPNLTAGCVTLPAAGAGGAEYLIVAVSAAGQETPNGVTVDYVLDGNGASAAAIVEERPAIASRALLEAWRPRPAAREFHAALRARERELARDPGARLGTAAPRIISAPPVLGSKDTFDVCANTSCTSFTRVIATAKYVGPKGAIYLDDVVPPNGFTQADLDTLGLLFDGGVSGAPPNMHQIDTTAFGSESDIDGNGIVIFLLTDAVNALSGSCPGGSIILGFFFGGDLLPRSGTNPGSNEAEIFYGLVPKTGGSCSAPKDFVIQVIAPTFIHEFQHMISYNQHVLVRGSAFSEETWLNEGLSHFAEELGGRLLGDELGGLGGATSRLAQFAIGDLLNANDYLLEPEPHFMVSPGNSTGTLEERGAEWLFVRWIADHYGSDANGTDVTRALVGTTRLGGSNVSFVTGDPMSELVPIWQLANYLDNLPGFAGADPRLQYESWNLRQIYDTLNAQRPDLVPREYPLAPDSTLTGFYARQGTLRAGSGRHVRIIQQPNAVTEQLVLARSDGSAFPNDRAVRLGIVRIR